MTSTEPVLLNGSAAAIAAAATPLLIEAGVNANGAGRIGTFVGAGAMLILGIWHLFSARSKVSPLEKVAQAALAVETTLEELVPVAAPNTPTPAPAAPESAQQAPEGAAAG